MTDPQNPSAALLAKLESLVKRQNDFANEIQELRSAIDALKAAETAAQAPQQYEAVPQAAAEVREETPTPVYATQPQATTEHKAPPTPAPKKTSSDLEKFIGENLIDKIGIAITVIGLAIGAKYSIENNLLTPLTRIVVGYLAGLGLLAFGIQLKPKYTNYSAVLVSGAMVTLYCMTYAAYGFYGLLPRAFAFVLMLLFTAFTVLAALQYNKQLIAHIGLVGAYAVPFLLSDNSGRVTLLFSYITLLNTGILVIVFKKYWKALYQVSFVLTWVIYILWYAADYQTSEHFGIALTFLSIFFSTFYLIALAYKLRQNQRFAGGDLVLLLFNALLFYGLGYRILSNHETGEQLLGLFTLCNAALHFIVSVLIHRQTSANRRVFYFVSALVLTFTTLTIPVQLEGNWVTLFWSAQAALVFWIGRTKNIPVYEKLSYPLMVVAFCSMCQDWAILHWTTFFGKSKAGIIPLLNSTFLTAVLCMAAFGFINFLNRNKHYPPAWPAQKSISKIISFALPAMLLLLIYYAFRTEIALYWNQQYTASVVTLTDAYGETTSYKDYTMKQFKTIWILNYSMLFVTLLAIVNRRKLKNQLLGRITLGLMGWLLAVFVTQGLFVLSELRESYLEQTAVAYHQSSSFNLGIRYLSLALLALMLWVGYAHTRQSVLPKSLKVLFEIVLSTAGIWIASSELLHWMDIAQVSSSYKLGLSMLWGSYALLLIALGIWKKKKHLRISAIVLFGITLIKLFFYDISQFSTLAKTIVCVALGILLLLIAFLYNKYKPSLSDENNA